MIEKAILVGIGLKSEPFEELKESLYELEDLVYAAGGDVVGTVAQVLEKFNAATLIGKGKTQEIKELVEQTEANLVVIDHHLSGIQSRNLEKEIGAHILDRNQLILDIFAQRAQTYEGKLQVELAQMLDQLPRMVGAWQGSLSRLGGGIGTRGPGETALEMDRRRIHNRVKQIKKKLDAVIKNREQHRQKRKRNEVPQFALIGYTNSGKSTLLNGLTQSDVFVKDQVFATLDPTTRKVHLPEIDEAVVTDTVGFINKLPTQLIEAFKATLEESAAADILIYVVDISSDRLERHLEVIDQLIEELKWQDKPILYVFNKVDQATLEQQVRADRKPRVFTSALKREGIERLRQQMSEAIKNLNKEVELFFPKVDEHKIYDLGREAKIIRTEKATEGTVCYANLTPQQISKWSTFLSK